MSDEELVRYFKSHQQNEVIDELFERYVHLVYGLCMKYFRDEEQARDIVMAIFEGLMEKIRKFEIQYFKSWLYMVARNTCLMELRRKKYEIPTNSIEIIRSDRMENNDDMHLYDEENQLEEKLVIYLHKLNNKQRLCLDMIYFQKKSYKEIAAETGLSLKEVKSHIQNGKRNLRNFLESGDD